MILLGTGRLSRTMIGTTAATVGVRNLAESDNSGLLSPFVLAERDHLIIWTLVRSRSKPLRVAKGAHELAASG